MEGGFVKQRRDWFAVIIPMGRRPDGLAEMHLQVYLYICEFGDFQGDNGRLHSRLITRAPVTLPPPPPKTRRRYLLHDGPHTQIIASSLLCRRVILCCVFVLYCCVVYLCYTVLCICVVLLCWLPFGISPPGEMSLHSQLNCSPFRAPLTIVRCMFSPLRHLCTKCRSLSPLNIPTMIK